MDTEKLIKRYVLVPFIFAVILVSVLLLGNNIFNSFEKSFNSMMFYLGVLVLYDILKGVPSIAVEVKTE